MDALAALLIVIHKKLRDEDYQMLQALFLASMQITLSLSVSQPFSHVASRIYKICHDKFYSKETELLEPFQDPKVVRNNTTLTESWFPIYYKPTFFINPDNSNFTDITKLFKKYGDAAVQRGYIEDNEKERVKVAYYSFNNKPAINIDDKLRNIMDCMNVDRRGNPGIR